MNWILVFLGGGAGSLARYGISLLIDKPNLLQGHIPWATLIANVLACFLLGIGVLLSTKSILDRPMSLLLLTGFCGGFSTFSTFSAELVELIQNGHIGSAGIYGLLSLISGGLAFYLIISYVGVE